MSRFTATYPQYMDGLQISELAIIIVVDTSRLPEGDKPIVNEWRFRSLVVQMACAVMDTCTELGARNVSNFEQSASILLGNVTYTVTLNYKVTAADDPNKSSQSGSIEAMYGNMPATLHQALAKAFADRELEKLFGSAFIMSCLALAAETVNRLYKPE